MCQTAIIKDHIIKLGKRSFVQRFEAVEKDALTVRKLAGLNRSLDDFYELLYEQFNTITEKDYKIFGSQMDILIKTVKELYDTCRATLTGGMMREETEKLGKNYSALAEIDSDIREFRIKQNTEKEMVSLLSQASLALSSLQ